MPVKFVFPFRRETLPALEWAAKENDSWKFKYYLALFRAANGEEDGADALLDACGAPDDATFYLYRAGRRIGAQRLADVLEAERRGGGWRAGLMRWRCESESGETAAALATAARLISSYPDVNPVKLAYAKALLSAQRFADCVQYLEGCTILPSEYGENANDIWREACYASARAGPIRRTGDRTSSRRRSATRTMCRRLSISRMARRGACRPRTRRRDAM